MTPVPMAFWLPEPAPVLIASGNTPMRKAKEVIRMGRKRNRAASIAASARLAPCWNNSRANSTIRMAFFDASPMVANRPIWKYTSLDSPRALVATKAPSTPRGTTKMTDSGMLQLSYSAARQRNTTKMDKA